MEKTKIEIEYPMKCTAASLYRALSTPAGLKEWFADKVEVDGNQYTFVWGGSPEKALLQDSREEVYLKYVWKDTPEYFLGFDIDYQEFTENLILKVTDFAYDYELEDTVNLWNLQVEKLKRSIGCVKN